MEIAPVVVIGSGFAGYSFIKEYRQLNADKPLVLITADRGDYYSKPQLSTALTNQRTPEQLLMHTAHHMAEKYNISIITHAKVQRIDRQNKKIIWENGECDYGTLVLALGAEVIHPAVVGDAAGDIISVNTLEDYELFREWLLNKKKIAVLGSGLVGCEFTNDLLHSGHLSIDVISLDTHPLSRFVPEKIGRALQAAFSNLGVHWHLGCCAIGVHHADEGYHVELSNAQTIQVDGVFSAVGLRARTVLAEQAGLLVAQGIMVDRHLRTNDPNIYALGDCANVNGFLLQYIAPLLASARHLAKIINGTVDELHYPPMPIGVKTPACALVAFPPPQGVQGEWFIDGEAPDLDARFYDRDNTLRGFALTGTALAQRTQLIKELPGFF